MGEDVKTWEIASNFVEKKPRAAGITQGFSRLVDSKGPEYLCTTQALAHERARSGACLSLSVATNILNIPSLGEGRSAP